MYIYLYFLFICAVAGFFAPPTEETKVNLHFFPYFLLFTLFVETIGHFLGHYHINNSLLYSLENVFEFGFYLYFLNSVLTQLFQRRSCVLFIALYVIISLINIFFIQSKYGFHTYTFILGCIFVIILCLHYFIMLLLHSKSIALNREPIFWIVIAIFFYHSLMLPLMGQLNYISSLIKSV
jgi:hypothetical protein